MAELFERDNEWGGFTIDFDKEGFVVMYHAHNQEGPDGVSVLVPYGTWGFNRVVDLNQSFDGIVTNGEALAAMALDDVKGDAEERRVRMLDRKPVAVAGSVGAAPAEPKARTELPLKKKEPGITWYTFSVPKRDELQFGNCHDLFTTMYLSHGLPRGMALWVKSRSGANENMFFVQIPEALDVAKDDFFSAFPLAECGRPSKIGLSFLVGNAA